MGFFVKNKAAAHVIFALSEILDVVVGIIINVVTSEKFNAFSTPSIVMWCVLVFFVAAHIGCGILLHNATQEVKNKQFLKAFKEHGGYDALASVSNL